MSHDMRPRFILHFVLCAALAAMLPSNLTRADDTGGQTKSSAASKRMANRISHDIDSAGFIREADPVLAQPA